MKTLADMAAGLEGYDPQALPAAAVQAFLSELVTPVTDTETLGIFDALGRVLAQDIISPVNVPPHDNSAMDGYAFAGAQLRADSPLLLRVVGVAFAGAAWQGQVGPGQCLKIMTGAVMPAGLDTVVPQEFVHTGAAIQNAENVPNAPNVPNTENVQDEHITIPSGLLRLGDNRRFAGEDIQRGAVALARGERLGPAALGLLASLGVPTVQVLRRLRVAYFSTGNEVLSLGDAPREGAVYDSNRYTVLGLLTRLGIDVIDLGVVRDDPPLLAAAFAQAAEQADAVLTSGGVSVGEADHTRTVMQSLGDVLFWRVAMRPGRPMVVGRIHRAAPEIQAKSVLNPSRISANSYLKNQTSHQSANQTAHQSANESPGAILFGLPGNPVAVMVSFLAFVRPALLRMMGCNARHTAGPPMLQARSTQAIRKRAGRTEYQRAWVHTDASGALVVDVAGNQGSGVLSSMVQANGLIVLEHERGNIAIGDSVAVMLLDAVV